MKEIEERKFEYLLDKAKTTEKYVDDYFKKIDERMKKIKIGSIVYEYDVFDGAYPQKIIEIIDKEKGIVKIYEESIKKESIICILERYLTLEEALNCLK